MAVEYRPGFHGAAGGNLIFEEQHQSTGQSNRTFTGSGEHHAGYRL
jgi:hypothetical protein